MASLLINKQDAAKLKELKVSPRFHSRVQMPAGKREMVCEMIDDRGDVHAVGTGVEREKAYAEAFDKIVKRGPAKSSADTADHIAEQDRIIAEQKAMIEELTKAKSNEKADAPKPAAKPKA